jgi:hypothetical protein
MLRILFAVALVAAGVLSPATPALAGGWSGGERDLVFAPFKRGQTLESTWLRLGSRR